MSARKDRTGETSVATNGMTMTIIAYRSSKDIDVQFEDGAVRKGVTYQCFIKGEIRHPKEQERLANLSESRIGETSIALNGMTIIIIAYRRCDDMDVQFEDGAVRNKVQYSAFKIGNISHPNELRTNFNSTRIGDISVATNGMKMTIIAYRSSLDIDVQFEDGAVRKGVTYRSFIKGKIRHPSEKDRTGETAVANNGIKMTIIAYRRYNDIDVQFDDEFHTRVKTDYYTFTDGYVKNPHFPMRGKGTYKTFETQYAYTAHDGSVYFYCECQKCGWKKNLTARELINLNHTCENIEGSEK